jgi:hypothetical protein
VNQAIVVLHGFGPSVSSSPASFSNHRRINAMLFGQKNRTGQPWEKPEDDTGEEEAFEISI